MTNSKKVGMNALSNQLWYLNGRINSDWLNLSLDTFKENCKKNFYYSNHSEKYMKQM